MFFGVLGVWLVVIVWMSNWDYVVKVLIMLWCGVIMLLCELLLKVIDGELIFIVVFVVVFDVWVDGWLVVYEGDLMVDFVI